MSHASPSPEQHERELAVRRELEMLGEEPPSPAELALVLERDPEVAIVSRLAELAEAESAEPLSELELHRAWRNVEQRITMAEPRPKIGGGSRRWLLTAIGGLAAAAGVLFMVFGPDRTADRRADAQTPSIEQVAEMGEQVRTALQALDDGKSDSECATELAADYQRRLTQQEHDG
jgi:hypothetical protein